MRNCPFCGAAATEVLRHSSHYDNARIRVTIGCSNEDCLIHPQVVVSWSNLDERPEDELDRARFLWNERYTEL